MKSSYRDRYDPGHTVDMGVTVDEAVSFIVEALEDPLNPRWCGPCVAACMIVIKFDHATAETLINRNHLFGSTIVAFLTAKRSIADIETLEAHWSICKCSRDHMIGHGRAVVVHDFVAGTMEPILAMLGADHRNRAVGRFGDKIDIIWSVVDDLARYLADAINKVKPFSVAKGRHPEIWPNSPKDLIPYGPETTLESLVMWSRFTRSSHVFALFGFILHICGPLVIPAIVASKSAPKYVVDHGLHMCSYISNAPLDNNGQVEDSIAKNFVKELEDLGSFIHGILSLPNHLIRDIHFGVAKTAFDFVTRALSIIGSPIMPQSKLGGRAVMHVNRMLADYASVLYSAMPDLIAVQRASIHPAILSAMNRSTTPCSPAESTFQFMSHARSIQFCFAQGCPESAQSSGRVYMRCSGCHIVAYHCKECQKRAWTDSELPHRDICKKMKQVYDVGGNYLRRKEDRDKFVREIKRAEISDSTLMEISVWLSTAFSKFQWKGSPSTTGDHEHSS